eukprot:TRINITY_DN3042_c0_g2_i1.p2 TRINITY_DN3042_c0_g2~~TRINITY_DN3042_c0_g2_i1.p2  ORF type:complete len:317 (+),score=64.33 TRINITY_DN3042_c0_g2_i1:32-952(+)
MSSSPYPMIDIGANLTDSSYEGIYYDKRAHESDLSLVLERARGAGVEKIIVTAGSLSEARKALEFVKGTEGLYSTVGVHPTRCLEFDDRELSSSADDYLDQLVAIAKDGIACGKVVAIGEFGLDLDRTKFCPFGVQEKYFEFQFKLAEETGLPLFLHMRACAEPFTKIVEKNRDRFTHGVVHSFDGTLEEAEKLLSLGLFIGLNGCSLKTAANLEVVSKLPQDRIMIETDAPWCQVRPSHAGSSHIKTKISDVKKQRFSPGCVVKGRNEPQHLIQVLEVIAGCRGEDIEELSKVVYQTTQSVFFPQ